MNTRVKLPFDTIIDVRSDLVQIGRCPEEGTPITCEAFYVFIEFANGARYAHCDRIVELAPYKDEEGLTRYAPIYDQCSGKSGRELARERAERLATKVAFANTIDLLYWDEVDPRYGSPAYESTIHVEQQ